MSRIMAGQIRSGAYQLLKDCHFGRLGALLLFGTGMPVLMAAPAATTTTLAVTANGLSVASVDAGAAVTLTATVESGGRALPLGQVNFCDATAKLCSDIHLLGTVPLTTAGTAALKFVPRAGSHSYKAEFVSTVNDGASASTAQPLLVYGATTTAITQSGSPGDYTLKATVTGTSVESAPAGNVEFRDTSNGNAVLATAPLGTGTTSTTWLNTQNPATLPQPLSIATGDFNGDGIPDIAIGTNGSTTGYLSILLGNGNGTFQAAKSVTALPNNQAMVAAHFVDGGPLDILTVDNNASGTNNAAMFIGNGAGGGSVGAPFSLGGIANVSAVAAGDFNRDGNEDFVITGVIYGIYCFAPALGTGRGTFGGPTLNAIGNNPLLVAVGAFNTNGYPDIVVVDTGVDQATVFQNNSEGYFFPEGQANTGAHPTAMVTGDFNGDGFLDLAVVNGGSNDVTILLGHGNETLTTGSTIATGHAPTSIAVGDFNGDGIADFAVVNSGDKTVSILLGKGDGTFEAGPTLATGINPVNVVTGDFSGTGLADLVVTNQDIAATTGSILTVQAAELTQTASATAAKVAPAGSGSHLVDAEYLGDSLYNTSTSATTSILASTLPTVTTPILSPAGGTYAAAQNVTILDGTAGATIYYTTNGSTPTTASTKYTGAIPVSASETVHAIAVKTGYNNSAVASGNFAIEAALPVFTPVAGTYASAENVTIADATKGAVIYYTTNGSTPTTASTKYSAPILVSASETIHAIAVATGYSNSNVATASYTIDTAAATPVFSVAAGTYAARQSVTITDATSGAVIYYTTNGTAPTTSSTKYTGAISVAASETLEAIAVASGHSNSAVALARYTIETPAATPAFSPAAGTYTAAQSVKITDATAGAVIYYTLNGATPTTASTKYTAAIPIAASETIKAIAVATGATTSAVASAAYVIEKPAATPVFSPAAGTYTAAQSVKITDATAGAVIYYTLNGATPTTASTKYTAAIPVAASETIKAIAVATGFTTSAIASAAYVIEKPAATPVFSPAAGTYTAAQSVKITDATAGAVIYYTLNGATPTTTSTKYTAAITVAASETIKAIAVATGFTTSAVASAAYVIEKPAATPVFSPAAGTYTAAQSVKITDASAGAVIYYTLNGATPTTASTKYTAAIPIAASETIKAIAVATGSTISAVASAAYVIEKPAATPVFSPTAGTYTAAQSVKITDATAGAVIYYTLNGATPTTASTRYTGPISVAISETLKAIAVASGYTNSAVATATYTIGYPIETVVVTSSGTNVLTIPVGGSAAFAVASENQSGQSYPSVTVKTSTGANPSLPVQVTLCQTNPSSGQCVGAPGPTVTLAPFAAGAAPTFSVFVTATAAIASSPSNEVVVLFTNSSGSVLGSSSVLVVTN
jgi:hypothetical protein